MTCRRTSEIALVLTLAIVTPLVAHAQNVDMGSAFETLESQVVRLEADFGGVTVEARRSLDGTLRGEIVGPGGEALGTMTFAPDRDVLRVDFPGTASRALAVGSRPFTRATLDWAAWQAYGLWRDRTMDRSSAGHRGELEWRDGLLRTRREASWMMGENRLGEAPGSPALRRVRTEFGAVYAESTRLVRREAEPTYVTRLFDAESGALLGMAQAQLVDKWYRWSIPGVSEGYLSAETVPGGWTFSYDMAWSNVQMFSFWRGGPEAEPPETDGAGPDLELGLERAARGGMSVDRTRPNVDPSGLAADPSGLTAIFEKNEPGCDGLHWLDGTNFRPCCDQHDECYYKHDPDCTWKSWLFQDGWSCNICNFEAILCFVTAAMEDPACMPGSACDPGNSQTIYPCCYLGHGGFCPAYCMDCYPFCVWY